MSSLVVFSTEVRHLAAFYEAVLGAELLVESSGDVRLVSDGDDLLIHAIPQRAPQEIVKGFPAAPRENASIKPVFDVPSLERALDEVRAAGGVVTDRGFSWRGQTQRDVLDPDGNVIQLRSGTP